MKPRLCCLVLLVATVAWAQAKLPLGFDTDPGWEMRPSYLANPTAKAQLVAASGVNTLQVDETGKGMKWELPLQPFDSGYYPYLVVRYRAQNLGGGGYSLWAFDGSREGLEIINPRDLAADGQWHDLAVDLVQRGVTGAVRALVVEVQCKQAPAYLAFDTIALQDDIPAGAKVVPAAPPEAKEAVVKLTDLPLPKAEPDWLAADAARYGIDVAEGAVHLWAEGQDAGMKFSTKLREPLDLSPFRFAAVRYKARGTAPWGDYCVWLGSGGGGMPDRFARPLDLRALKADGEWHVAITPLGEDFKAVDMALQVSTAQTRGDVWIDSIRFSTKRPLLEMADVLPYRSGWENSKLAQFRTVDLTPVANAPAEAKLRANGLKSWLPAGKLTTRGIPFSVLSGAKDVLQTPPDIAQTASVPVGGKAATEAYLLLLSRLPSTDAARMGDPVPMDVFRNPERFRVRVEYADGMSDEMFPLACGSGQFEVSRGPDVYCLTGLRSQPIQRLSLINRMESGSFLLAAVTLNEGKPAMVAPAVQALPPAPKPMVFAMPVPQAAIKPITGGYFIQSRNLCLDLQTEGGLAVRRLGSPYNTIVKLAVQPGPLFEIADGKTLLDSTQVTVGTPKLEGRTLTIPVDGRPGGAAVAGQLVVTLEDDQVLMRLDVANVGSTVIKPIVNFPLLRGMKIGSVDDTWYLYCRKGGLVSNRPTAQRKAYGGEYPLQVADVFNPQSGGLALLTYDLNDVYRFWNMSKDAEGVTWKMEYWQQEVQPGAKIETVPTALRGHFGDWRAALGMYRQWAQSWFRPQVPRKRWFQEVFYYQQALAWSQLRDPKTGQWRMSERIQRCKDAFGCLDYLHVFDFGDSRKYGRVGDYNHYDELGGLPAMRAAFKEAQDQGVRMGVYIEGYLCDNRGVWGSQNVAANCIRLQDGSPMMWPGSKTETMMCAAALPWRQHLADTYKRVAAELQPDGMYIDQYGFVNPGKTCWSREHGHPVPAAPIRGEAGTTQAIRAAMPPQTANLTEETPNDVHAQYQDGALGYSVVSDDPVLAPHRVDLFRFMFPDFKVFQLVSYNPFIEGGWDLLKWPFFNGEAIWLHQDPQRDYCDEARNFLKQSFAILHKYDEAFCSDKVAPLVPTLMPTVYANQFTGKQTTVWTLFNAEFHTMRGDLLSIPHQAGTRYVNAFTGAVIKPRIVKGQAIIPVAIGPRDVGCVAAERP
ncbi:DUF6259 domain-containing protein [bacterium]|nr:DUF6259 domain-containing protein [bacterium]